MYVHIHTHICRRVLHKRRLQADRLLPLSDKVEASDAEEQRSRVSLEQKSPPRLNKRALHKKRSFAKQTYTKRDLLQKRPIQIGHFYENTVCKWGCFAKESNLCRAFLH